MKLARFVPVLALLGDEERDDECWSHHSTSTCWTVGLVKAVDPASVRTLIGWACPVASS